MIFRRNLFAAFLSFVLSLVVLQTSDAQPEEKFTETFQQSYQLSSNGRVSLENINGNVRVEVWDKSEIKVDAVKSANMQEKLKDLEIKIDSSADSIRIKVKYPNTTWSGKTKDDWRRHNPGEVDFVLTVPRSARIDSIELINGNIDLKDLTGEVAASSINGKVTANNLTGDCKLSTINGKTIASFDRVDSGRNLSLGSVNGQVQVTLPSDLNAQIKASVVHGSISNNFGLNVRKGEYVGRDLQGVLGNGGARINLSNVNGSININRANDGKQLSNVTNLISATNDSKSPKGDKDSPDFNYSSEELREMEEEYAEAMREAQQEMREAQREVERARRDLQRAMKDVERARQNLEQNPGSEELKEALKEAQEEQKDAERELRDAEKELRNAQREIERNQRDRARDIERAREEIKRAQEEAKRAVETARIAQEAVKVSGVYEGYNNLRVVERDSATFKTQGTPRIDASTYDGSITIRAWDKDEVSCTVTKRAEDEQQIKGVKFNAQQNGSNIIIKADFDKTYAKKYKGGVSTNAVASLEINVPRNSHLKIDTGDGRLRIEGVNGNIEASTGDGGIEVRDCVGNIKIDTGDGRIYIVNHQGEASVDTGDGNIVLEGRFTKLFATTGDGSIVLSIPSNTNAIIEAEAETVLVDGLTATEESGNNQRLKRWRIGSGGTVFKLHTGDGRISVRKME
jgi:hypothetical protein